MDDRDITIEDDSQISKPDLAERIVEYSSITESKATGYLNGLQPTSSDPATS